MDVHPSAVGILRASAYSLGAMSEQKISRRAAAFLLLVIFVVGAIVVLRWLLGAALLALGFVAKLAVSLGGLLLLLLLVYLVVKAFARKD